MKKILTIAWGATAILGASGPLVRAITGIKGSGQWPIVGAALLMLIVVCLTLKRSGAWLATIMMSASAIAVGGAFGFALTGLLYGRTLPLVLAAKWLLVGLVLTWMFVRRTNEIEREQVQPWPERPEWDEESIKAMSPEERQVFAAQLKERVEKMVAIVDADIQNSKRNMVYAAGLFAVGAVAYAAAWLLGPH